MSTAINSSKMSLNGEAVLELCKEASSKIFDVENFLNKDRDNYVGKSIKLSTRAVLSLANEPLPSQKMPRSEFNKQSKLAKKIVRSVLAYETLTTPKTGTTFGMSTDEGDGVKAAVWAEAAREAYYQTKVKPAEKRLCCLFDKLAKQKVTRESPRKLKVLAVAAKGVKTSENLAYGNRLFQVAKVLRFSRI